MPGRETTAVFFFDVLGFSARIREDTASAIDALSDLAAILATDEIARRTGRWEHRYALSDSVFLTHRSAATALRLAGDLMFNLSTFGLAQGRPTLVRGGVAFGAVEHVRNVFLTEVTQPANLVGPAVLEAIELEGTGKGPRVFLGRELVASVQAAESALVEWLVREDRGNAPELLWLLPTGGPETFSADEEWIASVCTHAGPSTNGTGTMPMSALIMRNSSCSPRGASGGRSRCGIVAPPSRSVDAAKTSSNSVLRVLSSSVFTRLSANGKQD
jgi:hypothetical protein